VKILDLEEPKSVTILGFALFSFFLFLSFIGGLFGNLFSGFFLGSFRGLFFC